MKKLIKNIEDYIFSYLQKRCEHPGEMVAADILEGCVEGIEVKYCRRCGSIMTNWKPEKSKFTSLDHTWRRPDPFLWN